MYPQCNGCAREYGEHIYKEPYHNKIMIIGDMPSAYEIVCGELFGDSASKLLYRELYDAGIDMAQCYCTKAIKCNHNGDKPHKADIKRCREILHAEVQAVNPSHILTLGSLALEVLLGKTNITTNHGKLFDFNGISVIPTYSPASFVKQPGYAIEFRADLRYFANSMYGRKKLPDDFRFTIVKDYRNLLECEKRIRESEVIAYDIETTGLDHNVCGAKILMLGIATPNMAYIIPLEAEHYKGDLTAYYSVIDNILRDSKVKKVAHNAKFDNRWLRSRKLEPHIDFDTYLASYVLNVNTPHGLKWLAKTYCGAGDYGVGIEFKPDLTEEEFDAMAKYCALDVYYTLKLYDILKKEIQADSGLQRAFKYIVMPGERVLQRIEDRGVHVNLEELERVDKEYREKKAELEQQIRDKLPADMKEMNINSTAQLGVLLFDKLKLPILGVTSTGKPATGKSTLIRLASYDDLPKLILEYKKYEKAINGFLTPWKEFVKLDGRLHTTYNIAKTATGRLSAENPNLQQVPRDKNVRQLISAPPGKKFIEADYSQIELRIASFIAGEDTMKDVYRHNGDIHSKTAGEMAGVAPENVTKTQRTNAKAVNFGFLYGMGWKKFKDYAFDSYGATFTEEESQRARNAYFQAYPKLLEWHDRQRAEVNAYGYVRTATGRIRHLPDVYSPDREIRSGAERQSINTVVQSFASDVTVLAMILIDAKLEKQYRGKAFLVGQVHDAIMVQADDDVAHEVAVLVKKCMEAVPQVLTKYFNVTLDVPIVSDVELGQCWGDGELVEIPTE